MNNEIRTVTLEEARKALLVAMKCKRPVFIWGPPGIGKSDLMQQIADQEGGLLIDLRLNLLDPTDLKGMPHLDPVSGKMRWAAPAELPTEEQAKKHKLIILFLDELNSAAPAVQASAYQLTLNRRVGEYRLPDNVVIMAAGNREGDRGVTYRMPAPLANRFLHLEVRPDFDTFNNWAVNNKVHPDVVGFLNFSKDSLFDFRPESASRAFPTPRSWFFVSQLLNEESDDSTIMDLVSGCVGEGLAVKFMAHRKSNGGLPNPSDILSGKVTEMKAAEISAQYSLVTSLCYELKDFQDKNRNSANFDKKWHEMVDNFFGFVMNNTRTEVCILAVKTALQNYGLKFQGSKMKTYAEFAKKYGNYIHAAMQAK